MLDKEGYTRRHAYAPGKPHARTNTDKYITLLSLGKNDSQMSLIVTLYVCCVACFKKRDETCTK